MPDNEIVEDKPFPWLGLEAPRYTSYPSAHHFTPAVNETMYRGWLDELKPDTGVSVYVHIPFCRELCWFCGCHTKMTRHYEPIAKYVRVLIEEIALIKRFAGGRGKLVNIHFGGGSPSLLEAGEMMSILCGIANAFDMRPGGELAIELDPRTTTQENITLYAALGFNRVSIGIQDFDPKVQQAINRVQPYKLVASVMRRLREAGLDRINCDLIYGLPHQTPGSFRETLEKTIGLAPSRIALFSYAHVPHMKKHQRMIDTAWLPSDMEKLALYTIACDRLKAAGYTAIGIDHFAKHDDPLAIAVRERTLTRNFQGYVTDATQVLVGVGSSAISQFPQGYAQNSAHAADYRNVIASGKLPIVRGWEISEEDRLRKAIVDKIMCFMSVDLADIRQQHSLEENYFQRETSELEKPEYRGIVEHRHGRIHITTPHRMAARVVAAVFDQYRNVAAGRYSKVA